MCFVRCARGDRSDCAGGLVSDLCRINTLFMIMQAGSGHIGSSFSSTDIVTWLWTEHLRDPNGDSDDCRRLFFVEGPRRAGAVFAADRDGEARLRPAAEAAPVQWAAGSSRRRHALHRDQYRLARHGHLEGLRHGARQSLHRPQRPHLRDDGRRRAAGRPDLGVAAAGGQRAPRRDHGDRRSQQVPVRLRGRGGQRSRSDSKRSSASSAGKCAAATATTSRVLRDALAHFETVTDRPKVFIADTIKGKGVSFMEGIACGDQTYHFHAGAPSLKDYVAATRN